MRTTITEDNKNILDSMFLDGMTSKSKINLPKHLEAAAKTGLPLPVVIDWIGNKSRQSSGRKYDYPKATYTKGMSGYNMFIHDHKEICKPCILIELQIATDSLFLISRKWSVYNLYTVSNANKTAPPMEICPGMPIQDWAAAWDAIPKEEKALYKEKANAQTQADSLDPQKTCHHLMKQLDTVLGNLYNVGCDIAAIGIIDRQVLLGNGKMRQFLETKQEIFSEVFHRLLIEPGAIKEDTKAMRKEVASHMNKLYSTAMGKAQAFPYKKVADGSIQIVGLPEEVLPLRVMSHYGVENLKLLLNCQEITVSVGEAAASTETTEAAGTSETTEAAASTETPEDTGSIGPSENSDNHTISEEDVRVLAPLLLGRDVSIVDTVEDADSERRSEMTKRKCRNAKGRKVKPTKKMKKELNLSMYDVERITDMRCKNQEQQYFIKWLGYPDTENTWEPEKNIPVDIVNSYLST